MLHTCRPTGPGCAPSPRSGMPWSSNSWPQPAHRLSSSGDLSLLLSRTVYRNPGCCADRSRRRSTAAQRPADQRATPRRLRRRRRERRAGQARADETPRRPQYAGQEGDPKASKAARPDPSGTERAAQRRRAELQARADEVEADYREAEQERAEAESVLDANQHQVADLQATIDRLTEELDHARQQLKTAQRDTARLERALDCATRTAAAAQRRRDAQQQRLANFDN